MLRSATNIINTASAADAENEEEVELSHKSKINSPNALDTGLVVLDLCPRLHHQLPSHCVDWVANGAGSDGHNLGDQKALVQGRVISHFHFTLYKVVPSHRQGPEEHHPNERHTADGGEGILLAP